MGRLDRRGVDWSFLLLVLLQSAVGMAYFTGVVEIVRRGWNPWLCGGALFNGIYFTGRFMLAVTARTNRRRL